MKKKVTVLVVDDDLKHLRLMMGLLAPLECRIITAQDGEEALIRTKKDKPDVILLDVLIPEKNGYEVCELLKSNADTATIPVIMITSLKERENRIMGIRVGATDFISKPVDGEELIFRVRNAVFTKRLFDQVEEKYSRFKTPTSLKRNKERSSYIQDLKWIPLSYSRKWAGQ